MNGPMPGAPLSLSISAVERDTGLTKDTLRVWERRYGFPTPQRDAQGERLYPFDQIEKLRLIKRLLDAGHRPGRVVAQPTAQLQQLIDQFSQPLNTLLGPTAAPPFHVRHARAHTLAHAPSATPGEVQHLLGKVLAHDVPGLRRDLSRAAARCGLYAFIFEIAGPLLNEMNAVRLRGGLQRYQELWARECLESALREQIAALPSPPPDARPRMVLTTLPNEPRGLGRLMMHGLATLHGVDCINLGQQVPVLDIAQAVGAHQADIVGICFSVDAAPGPLFESLRDLRGQLPAPVEIWAACTHLIPLKHPIPGVQMLTRPTDLETFVNRWRDQHQMCV